MFFFCQTCARNKTPHTTLLGFLKPFTISYQSILINFKVKLPFSKEMNIILVIVDHLTKIVYFIPTRGLLTKRLQNCLSGKFLMTIMYNLLFNLPSIYSLMPNQSKPTTPCGVTQAISNLVDFLPTVEFG